LIPTRISRLLIEALDEPICVNDRAFSAQIPKQQVFVATACEDLDHRLETVLLDDACEVRAL
jgi:hypothetical protein